MSSTSDMIGELMVNDLVREVGDDEQSFLIDKEFLRDLLERYPHILERYPHLYQVLCEAKGSSRENGE